VKRLTVWVVSTAGGVVLLFSYHTSTSGPAGGKVVAGIAPVGVVAESAGPDPSAAASTAPAPAPSRSTAAAQRPVLVGPKARVATTAPVPARPSTAPPPPPPTKAAVTTRTVNGAAVDTRYGPVQVQIKVRGSRIVSADAIVYPDGEQRDQEINSQAIPQLDDETLQAQSAQIDTVSGATYTSDGYRQSLQSALDAAHLS
jgi:uncharacterized protein with FMN-binding domain